MIWTINKSRLIKGFLVGEGLFAKENLDILQGANLNEELEGASSLQKLLVISAIKFYLNYFYENTQSTKFNDLNIEGIEYEEILQAPDIRLRIDSNTWCKIFESDHFDSVLHQNWVCNYDDSNEWLKENINYNKNGYLNLEEKKLLSLIIVLEPELIDPEKKQYLNISPEVSKYALKNIISGIKKPTESNKYLKELAISKVFEGEEVNFATVPDKIIEIIKSDKKIPTEFLEIVFKEAKKTGVLFYYNRIKNLILGEKLPLEIQNIILNKLPFKDIIKIIKHAEFVDIDTNQLDLAGDASMVDIN